MKKLLLIGLVSFLALGCSNAQHHRYGSNFPRDSRELASNDRTYRKNYTKEGSFNVRSLESYHRQTYKKLENARMRGAISRKNYNQLINMYEKINAKEYRFKRDGRMTNQEVNIIRRDLNNLDRMINQKMNGSRRSKF
jgi:hypothetical protein